MNKIAIPGTKTELTDWTAVGARTRGKLEKKELVRGDDSFPRTYWTLEGITGVAAWESVRLEIAANKQYSLAFSLKCIGQLEFEPPPPRTEIERIYQAELGKTVDKLSYGMLWPRVVDFIGVELVFEDEADKVIATRRFPLDVESYTGVSGWDVGLNYIEHRTDPAKFWLPVNLTFTSPHEARAVKVRFLVESRAKLEAGIAVADIDLKTTGFHSPPAQGHCRFIIRTVDSVSRRQIGCRLSFIDGNGKSWAADSAIVGHYPRSYFYSLTGETWLDVPVGHYFIEAVRGFEYEVAVAEARYVHEGQTEVLELEMVRRIDLSAANWFSGDHHLHLSGHAKKDYPAMDCQLAMELGASDGQSYFPFQLSLDGYLRGDADIKSHGAVGHAGMEITNHLWGHFCTFGASRPYERAFIGHRLYPTMYDVVKTINQRGGACVAAHPTQMIEWPANTVIMMESMADSIVADRFNCAKELPLILLLGEPCGFDLLIADGCGVQAMATREYYRLLSFGFKVAACGSTDAGANSSESLWPTCRTYVKAADLSFREIAKGYRNANTFASNGPVVRFKVNGAEPGETITIGEGENLAIECECFSPWGLGFVEFIYNGQVADRRELSGRTQASVRLNLVASEAGWIAAVVRGPGSSWVNSSMFREAERTALGQIAHTSPISVRFRDEAYRPDERLCEYYKTWISNLRKVAEKYRSYLENDAAAADVSPEDAWGTIMQRIDKALARIERIRKEGWPISEYP